MKPFSAMLVAVAVCCQCCPSLAGSWKESMLQNDLLAASSWALFDIDPYSIFHADETARSDTNETLDQSAILESLLYDDNVMIELEPEDLPKSSRSDVAEGQGQKRQLLLYQGDRPFLKVELRLLKMKLIEVYDKTYITLFLGTGVKGYLDDIFSIKSRANDEQNFLVALEELVSMIGVDGPSCVHRLLCDLGATPALKANNVFGEMVDATIRYILESTYADQVTDVSNSIDDQDGGGGSSSSGAEGEARGTSDKGSTPSTPISYLDAVAAGRHGAECAYKFSECPISLLSMLKLINDENL